MTLYLYAVVDRLPARWRAPKGGVGGAAVVPWRLGAPVVLASVLDAVPVPTTRTLAAHQDVNAIDLAGADEVLAKELEIAAADNLKRVLRPQPVDDWSTTPGTDRMTAFLETKTVWHPTGSLGASGSAY